MSDKDKCQEGEWGTAPVCPKCLGSSGMVLEDRQIGEYDWTGAWRCIPCEGKCD